MNRIPDSFKISFRLFAFNIGNYNLSSDILSEEFFKRPKLFKNIVTVFNNNLILNEFYTDKRYSVGAAEDRVKYYLKSVYNNKSFPVKELEFEHFDDFRLGICQLAEAIACKKFKGPVLGYIENDEDWSFGGSELELIFTVYLHNIILEESSNKAKNHEYAMSRVEQLLYDWYADDEDYESPLEEWETELII